MVNQSRLNKGSSLTVVLAGAAVAAAGYGLWRLLKRNTSQGSFSRSSASSQPTASKGTSGNVISRAATSESQKSISFPAVKATKRSVKWIPGLRVREQRILDVIPHGRAVCMSDIEKHFKNVTERTLRRDMDRLVRKGRVKRSGTTRSTTYIKL